MDYRVCWNCRRLFPYNISTSSKVDDHIRACMEKCDLTAWDLEARHFVCDQQDFYAMKHLKKFLSKNIGTILNAKKDLLKMGFPLEFIDSLLIFCRCKVLIQSNSFCDQRKNGNYNICNCSSSEVDESIGGKRKEAVQNFYKEVKVQDGIMELLNEEEKDRLAKQCKLCQKENLQELECKLCGYRNKSSKLMLRHLNSHGNNDVGFTCSNCNFSTTLRRKWNRHQCRNGAGSLVCKECGELHRTKAELEHHVKSKHISDRKSNPPKLFKCKECSYVGRDMTSLSDHQRKHTGEYIMCDKPGCSFRSPYKRALMQHLQEKHSSEKAQVCHVCGFRTSYVTSLRKHMRLHEQTKQYKCAHCSYACFDSSSLAAHTQRKHLKEKKYLCSECPFKTGYAVALKKHLENHEKVRKNEAEGIQSNRKTKAKQYNCSSCSETFATAAKMKKHSRLCQQSLVAMETLNSLLSKPTVCEVFPDNAIFHDSRIEDDVSPEVLSITSNMLEADIQGDHFYTVTVEDPMNMNSDVMTQENFCENETESVNCKERNPMLASGTLAAERSSPLFEESLFNLMSDFPKPPSLNRCQSASTLMFASLSPHLVDRALTPDFLSDNPASSFFQSLSRNMEQDNLAAVGSLN